MQELKSVLCYFPSNIRNLIFQNISEPLCQFIEEIRTVITIIKDSTNGEINLPNIGITVNNKFVELVATYRNNHMCFYSADLRFMLSNYLLGLLDQGIAYLNSYADILNDVRKNDYTKEQINKLREEVEKCIQVYRAIDDKVFEFKFERDIQECLNIDVEYYKEIEEIGGYNLYKEEGSETLKRYNEELRKFGIAPVSIKNNEVIKLKKEISN